MKSKVITFFVLLVLFAVTLFYMSVERFNGPTGYFVFTSNTSNIDNNSGVYGFYLALLLIIVISAITFRKIITKANKHEEVLGHKKIVIPLDIT